jgi:hypothetical protein
MNHGDTEAQRRKEGLRERQLIANNIGQILTLFANFLFFFSVSLWFLLLGCQATVFDLLRLAS